MPRAKRYFLPGFAWHITHRCHNREFLFKLHREKRKWLSWLLEAKKRYDIRILNYSVTSNHIHLIVFNDSDHIRENAIAKTIHLAASRTAWEFNHKNNRKGAFWEDRYHATAIETDIHLIQCMIYIDLNMVRAAVVDHPRNWPFCGYSEIQNPKRRGLIDLNQILELLSLNHAANFQRYYKFCLEEKLKNGDLSRDSKWTKAIAVGSSKFISHIKEKLGSRAHNPKIKADKEILQA